MPEHAEALPVFGARFAKFDQTRKRAIYTEELVIPGDHFDQTSPASFENGEILDVVQEPDRRKQAIERTLKGNLALIRLLIDTLPVEEVLPLARKSAYFGIRSVREENERVRMKKLRDRLAPII